LLNVVGAARLKENHIAEGMANGKVGSHNQYVRYFFGLGTLNEQPIPRGRLAAATSECEQRGRIL
jgi:hypothetical protein